MVIKSNELYHHGILGQKWGIRRFQNSDGSLTEEGKRRYGHQVKKLEKKARIAEIKRSGENPHDPLIRINRRSTGANYNKAMSDFQSQMKSDKEFKKLSKDAFDTEKTRLLYEDKFYKKLKQKDPSIDFNESNEKVWKDKKYWELVEKSEKAAQKKHDFYRNKAKDYADTLQNAKIKDIGLTDNIDIAKQYLKKVDPLWNFDITEIDTNLEYNPDSWYSAWVDEQKFKW